MKDMGRCASFHVYTGTQSERTFVSTITSIRYFIPGRTGINCSMIKQLDWDSSTENLWLDVNSYKDPIGNFPFLLFDLGVPKVFFLPISECR